jgi:hypothetical protein
MSESLNDPLMAIIKLAHHVKDIEHRAIAVYEPVVNAIVASRCTDVNQIEQTLDGLLDFAGGDGGLRLFKSLCRYYWQIDQAATASYIHSYRDTWDNEESNTPKSNNPEAL